MNNNINVKNKKKKKQHYFIVLTCVYCAFTRFTDLVNVHPSYLC